MTLDELAAGPPLDAAIIGGGINGCAIALELAARGQRVALFEQDDFGFGTTWRSTRLIHGGLRYLEHGDVRLVAESLRERAWLLRTRPHLVRPLRFLLPRLPWTRWPTWQLHAGLTAYDALAFRGGLPRHRSLPGATVRERAPALTGEAWGGFSFFDARAVSPERLALELALEAKDLGADVFNHARVTGIEAPGGRVAAVCIESGGRERRARTRAVVNAAGPWVDVVNRLLQGPPAELLGVTRGSHIVLEPAAPLGRDAIFTNARSDGRVFFAIPHGRLLLVGTTDDRYEGPPGDVAPTADDVSYLLSEAQALLPGLALTRGQVRYAYAGLRPLQRVKGGPEAAITRRHAVISHRGDGVDGLYSVIGGKLSTFRPLAREVAARLGVKGARDEVARCAARPLPDALPDGVQRRLRRYGPRASDVAALGTDVLPPDGPVIDGEVRWAVRKELATTLSDIMLRRTGLGWGADRGLGTVEAVAHVAGAELGWSAEERERQVASFRAEVERHLPSTVSA